MFHIISTSATEIVFLLIQKALLPLFRTQSIFYCFNKCLPLFLSIQIPTLMKPILITLLCFAALMKATATTKTAIANTGQGWNVASNWSSSGVPQNGDTVVIPAGDTISVKTNIYNSLPNIVIKVYGTLLFTSGGKLELGIAAKIFVYTGGFISGSSPSEVIKINGVSKYKGNTDGTIVGPAYSDILSGTSPAGFALNILPVKFQSFTAKTTGRKQATFNWIVSDESQVLSYALEKSIDNRSWKTIRIQNAKTHQQTNIYSDLDSLLTNGISYYRVKAEGYTGEHFYSNTEKIEDYSTKGFTIYPNPVSSRLRLQVDPTQLQGGVTVSLFNSNAVRAEQFHFENTSAGNLEMNISHLAKGTYRVVLIDAKGTRQDQTVIIY